MKNDSVFISLLKQTEENGIIRALSGVLGRNIKVNMEFGKSACDTPIDELDFSARASNCLKRAGVFTVGGVIDAIAEGRLSRIRNMGAKTRNEVKTRLLAFGYSQLTPEQKQRFLHSVAQDTLEFYSPFGQ